MAEMLSGRCDQQFHGTTVAKMEAGTRSVRINEAIAIADLFEVTVDQLVGRQEPNEFSLTYAMENLSAYSGDTDRRISAAQEVAVDVLDILEDIGARFNFRNSKRLQSAAADMAVKLAEARELAAYLNHAATAVIAAGSRTDNR